MSKTVPRKVVAIVGMGGIGQAIAHRLGAGRLLFLADFSETLLENSRVSLQDKGHLVHTYKLDVTDRAAVEEFAKASAAAGPIETVVNTAGVSGYTGTSEQILQTNLLGTALVIDAFLQFAVPGTSLVTMSSTAAHMSAPASAEVQRHLALAPTEQLLDLSGLNPAGLNPQSAYGLAKQGNMLRVQAMARAWGERGARINSISPGIVATTMGRAAMDSDGPLLQAMIDVSGSRRRTTPDDIAQVVAFLAGPDSSNITGTDIIVDGGGSAGMRWHHGWDPSSFQGDQRTA